jgi:MFS family permease
MQKTPERWLVMAMVMTGVFLSTMDSGMMNVALPTILRTFFLPLREAEFLVSIYLGTITVTLVFWGRLADLLGRGRVYLLGVLVFTIGLLCCYLAPSFPLLLVSRFLQALGAAMMMATGPALIKTVFPADHLGRSLGLVGIATACGLLSGPMISGVILHHASWRQIFLVSLPVCLLVLLLGRVFGLQRFGVTVTKEKSDFDWLGSCCWVALVVVGLTLLHRLDRLLDPANLLVALVWGILLWCFVHIEGRAVHPILPLQLLRQRYYWVAVLTAALSFVTMFIVLVVTPFYLTYALQLPVKEIGKVMTAVPAMLILLSPLSGRLYDIFGARILTTAGLGLCCLALLGLASLNGRSGLMEVALFLALLGAGQSVFLTPNSASVLSQVDELWVGITAGILATARNFGMVVGATLAAWLLSWWFVFYSGGMELSGYTSNDQGALVLAVKTTFLFAACLALLGGVFSARRG